jgi:hypothetical protein
LDSAPAKITVEKWFAKLKLGEMCIEGDARNGRLKEAVSGENIKKAHKIILNDRKVIETLKISKKTCRTHRTYLDMLKLWKVVAARAHNRSKSTTC